MIYHRIERYSSSEGTLAIYFLTLFFYFQPLLRSVHNTHIYILNLKQMMYKKQVL